VHSEDYGVVAIYFIGLLLMGFSYWQSVGQICVITIIYSFQGSVKSVNYGYTIQICLIVISAVVTCTNHITFRQVNIGIVRGVLVNVLFDLTYQ
jgi:hypothetical protein